MKNFLLRNLALSVLFAGAMQATTITWNFSTGTAGTTTNSENLTWGSGGPFINVTGFLSSGGATTPLFGKAAGGDEDGLGLSGFSDNEIAGNGFIQLDLSNLVGYTNFTIAMNSTTIDEQWKVVNCGTSGTLCVTSPVTGGDEGVLHFHNLTVGNVSSTGRYLDIQATSGNVLLFKLTADTASVPEPSTVSFMLLSGILLCGVSFFKAKRA